MALDNLGKIRERLAQRTRARAESVQPQLSTAAIASDTTIGAVRVGDRVFDRVSGQHGEVIGGTSENIVIPAAKRTDG